MLILTRRVGETVMIGNEVTVTVLGVKGNQVRIGINAPKTSPCIAKRSSSASRQSAQTAIPPATLAMARAATLPRATLRTHLHHGRRNGASGSGASGNGASGNGSAGNGAINGNGHYHARS